MKIFVLVISLLLSSIANAQTIRVGAKHFNEGYILSEIISQLVEAHGLEVDRRYNLGGTMVCFEALRERQIDIYPEYTGTITSEILKTTENLRHTQINEKLAEEFNMNISTPYGFNNTYALVMQKELAEINQVVDISDLREHPEFLFGLSYEFLKRNDGWENLAQRYGLFQKTVALEHGLAYQALTSGKINVTDAYSTDGEITRYNLVVLNDNLNFFPEYQAVSLYRSDITPAVKEILTKLDNIIDESEMQEMNASVLYKGKTFETVAHDFLVKKKLINNDDVPSSSFSKQLIARLGEHILLTLISIIAAIIIAVPIGIFIHWSPSFSRITLYITGLLQTIPSIALLAIMIPLFGIGITPAIVALFLYALLPIVRNTLTGISNIDPTLIQVADSLGMTRRQKLFSVELPLGVPVILSGIRIATVINIGTATLAAFIGAGGLGEFIVTGLALNDTRLILSGAIPAAILAIIVEVAFEFVEKKFRKNRRPVH